MAIRSMEPAKRVLRDGTDQNVAREVALAEYSALREEISVTLSNQQSALTFGSATVGVFVVAGAELWDNRTTGEIAGAFFLCVIPLVCFMVLLIWSSEQLRLTRAGLFMRDLEQWINDVLIGGEVLVWEGWAHTRGHTDVERTNQRVVLAAFLCAAGASFLVGREKLVGAHEAAWATYVAWATLAAALPLAYALRQAISQARLNRDDYKSASEGAQRKGGDTPEAGARATAREEDDALRRRRRG